MRQLVNINKVVNHSRFSITKQLFRGLSQQKPMESSEIVNARINAPHVCNTWDNTDNFEYTEEDFIYQTAPWCDDSPIKLSRFDLELRKRWDIAMNDGVFRYNIGHIVTRILPGPKHYVAQLNTLRARERRRPQEITSVHQQFNPEDFNFTRVQPKEVIFNLVNKTETSSATGSQCSRNDYFKNGVPNGYLVCNGKVDAECSSCETKRPERHTLVVNVSPMEYGHCLLVPQIDKLPAQILTEVSIQVALETILLSSHRGLLMGFNSLCAFASVNHLHFHLYYLEHELIADHCPVTHLGGKVYEMTAVPCPGFGMQLHGSTVQKLARLTHRISDYFIKNEIAHNVFICRGPVFGEDRNSFHTTVRLFIWPRKKFIVGPSTSQGGRSEDYMRKKSCDEFNVACIELGGHLPIKEEAGYNRMTEEEVDEIIADACIPDDDPLPYAKIKEEVIRIGIEEDSSSDI
uniref:GDP-D-glucose phosphorylase 1 n=1 Tax=Biomphalaria glabrata TaxID=6526 RepID=A0A2C9LAB3_BIOGL